MKACCLLLCLPFVSSLVIPLPSPPHPLPEPPTVTADFTPLTAEKQPVTELKVTSKADFVPREEERRHRVSRKRVRLHAHKSVTRTVDISDKKCNDDNLQTIMEESITPSMSTTKMLISERATRDFGSSFDVICARGLFSYYVDASTYCEVTKNNITCFAYHSTFNDVDKKMSKSHPEKSKSKSP